MNNADLFLAFGLIDEDLIAGCEESEFRLTELRPEAAVQRKSAAGRKRHKGWAIGLAAACCAVIVGQSVGGMFRCGSAAPEETASVCMTDMAALDEAPAEAPAAPAPSPEASLECAEVEAPMEPSAITGGGVFDGAAKERSELKENGASYLSDEPVEFEGRSYIAALPEDCIAGETTDKEFNGMQVYKVQGFSLEERFIVYTDKGDLMLFVSCEEEGGHDEENE